jgi:uncharacterized protein
MKYILLFLIAFYQRYISALLTAPLGIRLWCRYEVSCSQYAQQNIEKYGTIKGSYLAIKRIASCQPFTKIQ